ncbi:MAG: DUF3108 domain-containing protein [Saprospiraceae bacterium]
MTVLKHLFLVFIFGIFSSFSFPDPIPATYQDSIKNDCSIYNSTFKAGEELTYKLYYNWNFIWLSAGEVTFKVTDLGPTYHISAVGQTYSSYEWFFKVRDHYQVFLEKETLLPKESIRDVHEGDFQLFDHLSFDHANKQVTSRRGKTRKDTKTVVTKVDNCVHDVLSILYYMRNVNYNAMRVNETIPINIFIDNEIWPLGVKYKGKEKEKKIKGLGDFNVLKFSPEVIAGNVFEEGTEMTIYASDDFNRIPLLIESPVSVGSVKAVLKDYKGLKYSLASKTD